MAIVADLPNVLILIATADHELSEHSDSEESNTTTAPRLPHTYQQKSYYNKLPYSSQSTPRRRYQHDGTKSTRSSSTASENKITFNEDEYTRITTPRQDVLFKKGYLNKPRSYQTQTSTGTSTTSTGNSTGNGTPDHQSTDLDYESQFVFPNGFVDQNGIYYVNSFEPYPLMLYNPPTYYNEFSNCKSKRYSTGSLTESTSPHNEEATSQDLSGGEASNNVSDYSNHHSVYNMVYPGYYVNGVCHPQDGTEQCPVDQIRRIKKRKRRKTSKSQMTAQESTECSDEESESCNEDEKPLENQMPPPQSDSAPNSVESTSKYEDEPNATTEEKSEVVYGDETKDEHETSKNECEESNNICEGSKSDTEESKDDNHIAINDESTEPSTDLLKNSTESVTTNFPEKCNSSHEPPKPQKYDLKPDAEEFIPRAYRTPEIPLNPVQFIEVSPNFVPLPVVPFHGQNFNPAFIPSGIPINFLPPDPKMFPNFVGFVPNAPKSEEEPARRGVSIEHGIENKTADICYQPNNTKEEQVVKNNETCENRVINNKTIDLAKIVSKLKEAVKKQEESEETRTESNSEQSDLTKIKHHDKQVKVNQKYRNNHRGGFYNSPRNSPQRKMYHQPSDDSIQIHSNEKPHISDEIETSATRTKKEFTENSPENKKSWRPHYQNGTTKWQPHGFHQSHESKTKQNRNIDSRTIFDNEINQNIRDHSENMNVSVPNEKPEELRKLDINVVKAPPLQTYSPDSQRSSAKDSSPTQKPQNQWISVSSRKKRKNKNTEENEASFDDAEDEHFPKDDLFENYDVNLLVDVVPTSKEDITEINIVEGKVEDIITIISQAERSIPENIHLISNMKSVTEIENELMVNECQQIEENSPCTEVGEPKESDQSEDPKQLQPSKDDIIEVTKSSEFESISEMVEEPSPNKIKNKKKSKKGSQKPLTKRVIITDIDLSSRCEEIKEAVKKIVKKIERTDDKLGDVANLNEKVVEVDKIEDHSTESVPTAKESSIKDNEDEKKISKKKKKKSTKTVSISTGASSSSVAASLNLVESFDYLLESSLVGESDKTNDDISQELDKLIQKGMYSSLEGKIKSLNIDEDGGFFKSVFSKISSRETSVEKTGYSSTPDFTKIPLFMPVSVSEATSLENMKANKKLPTSESPEEDGFFLDNPDLRQIPDDQTVAKEDTGAEEVDNINGEVEEHKTLYPITEAVKEWLVKTRETTPDVEILKSPKTIYKEFYESVGSDSATEVSNIHKLPELSVSARIDDGEITIFSMEGNVYRRESEEQDLLEYWEDEVKNSDDDARNHNHVAEVISGVVDKGEDVLEVYESKYGNNEDYLNLQREIKEKVNNSKYPKHGNLPYRAICCNIM